MSSAPRPKAALRPVGRFFIMALMSIVPCEMVGKALIPRSRSRAEGMVQPRNDLRPARSSLRRTLRLAPPRIRALLALVVAEEDLLERGLLYQGVGDLRGRQRLEEGRLLPAVEEGHGVVLARRARDVAHPGER